jgi:formylmethanofuran dehydrogenase subunit B
MTPDAAIAGRPASLDDAIAAAAALLGAARRFVIGGLEADAAAIEAAIGLARRHGGGAVDHPHAAAALRDLRAMRETGWIVTTPLQVRALADVVLLAGMESGADRASTEDLAHRLWLDRPPSLHPERERTVLRLGDLGGDPVGALGLLRARLLGRGIAMPEPVEQAAAALRGASYAVVVWSAAGLGIAEIELLCGIVDDLNATTRAAGLPLPPAGNAMLAMQVAAWTTGLPLPLGFDTATGAPRHDSWRYDARRMVAEREAQAAVWLSATGPAAPPWAEAVPTIVLAPPDPTSRPAPAVAIGVGRPGIDHDGVLFDDDAATLVHRAATAASGLPAAADVIARIARAMAPC